MPKFNMYQSLHTTVIGPGASRSRSRSARTRCTAGPSTASPRTGSTRRTRPRARRRLGQAGRPVRPGQRHGVAAPAARLAAGDRRPGRVPRLAAVRDQRRRGLRLHPEGRGRRRCRPGRRPSTSPTRCTPRSATAASARRVNGRLVPLESPLENGDVVEVLTSKADGAGPSRDWLAFVKSRPRPQQDPPVVLQGAPRGGDRARQGRHRQGDAQAGPAAAAAHVASSRSPASRTSCATRTSTACTRRSARATSRPSTSSTGSSQSLGGEEGASEDLAEADRPGAARRTRPRAGDPGVVVVKGVTTSGSSWPGAAPRCPATTSSASSPAATASRCTARDCTNADSLLRADRIGSSRSSGRPARRACSSSSSRSRRSTAPGCCRDVTRVLSDHARQHPLGVGHDVARPGGPVPVHLRDGRPGAPRPRHPGGPADRRRLRRLPDHRRQDAARPRLSHYRVEASAARSYLAATRRSASTSSGAPSTSKSASRNPR